MTATLPRHPATLGNRRIAGPALCRILVLDGYVTFAEALARRLDVEPGMEAFAATTIDQARRMLAESRFDIVLLDVELDGQDGLRFADEALSDDPDIRIVVVTAGKEHGQVAAAVWVGVSGWVPKSEPIEHLLAVVRGALRGETWIPPPLLTHVLAELKAARRDHSERDALLARLTRREKEIMCCLVAGMSVDATAARLYLSRNTVRTHIQNVLGKLNVHSAVAAVAVARRAGLSGTHAPQPEPDGRAPTRLPRAGPLRSHQGSSPHDTTKPAQQMPNDLTKYP
jgi:DNA-binding NarL/FixJ family response regulator